MLANNDNYKILFFKYEANTLCLAWVTVQCKGFINMRGEYV